MSDAPQPAQTEPTLIECPPTKDPAVRWFIVAVMMIGFSAYTVYDHYVLGNYPKPDPYALNPYLKYLFNHYVAYLLAPIGLIALVAGVRHLTGKLLADRQGIAYTGRAKIRWDQVKLLDASQLESKGMLKIRYGDDEELTLDSWKLRNFRDLVAFVEKMVPPDIVRR